VGNDLRNNQHQWLANEFGARAPDFIYFRSVTLTGAPSWGQTATWKHSAVFFREAAGLPRARHTGAASTPRPTRRTVATNLQKRHLRVASANAERSAEDSASVRRILALSQGKSRRNPTMNTRRRVLDDPFTTECCAGLIWNSTRARAAEVTIRYEYYPALVRRESCREATSVRILCEDAKAREVSRQTLSPEP